MIAALLTLGLAYAADTPPDLRALVRGVLEQPNDAERLAWLKRTYDQARVDRDTDLAMAVFPFRLLLEPAMRFGELPEEDLRGWLRIAVTQDEAMREHGKRAAFLGARPPLGGSSYSFPDGRPGEAVFREWQRRYAVVRWCEPIVPDTLVGQILDQRKDPRCNPVDPTLTPQEQRDCTAHEGPALVAAVGRTLAAPRPFLKQVAAGGAPDTNALESTTWEAVTTTLGLGFERERYRELEAAVDAWNVALAAELDLDEGHLRVLADAYPAPDDMLCDEVER